MDDWSEITASLIPKVAVPKKPKDFRPIAALTALRKLVGYVFMMSMPEITYRSFQCGFVKKRDATQAVFCLKRMAELGREWGKPVFAAQLDMSKAFDRVKHSAVLQALMELGASAQHLGFLASLLLKGSTVLRLGNVRTRKVHLDRGVPQGAPESPWLFIAVTDMVLNRKQLDWASRGIGFSFDGVWLPAIAYADDVMVLANSEEELAQMLAEVAVAFGEVGLELNMAKTNYTSSLPACNSCILVNGEKIKWRKSIIFLGSSVTLSSGNDETAMRHRKAAATGVFEEWAPVLTNQRLPADQRARAFRTSVVPCFTWQAQTWSLTKAQVQHAASWSARLGSRMAGARRTSTEGMGQWWCRLHRDGKRFLQNHAIDIPREIKLAKHNFAGHAARMPCDDVVSRVLHLRHLAWWRRIQTAVNLQPSSGPRPHPRRFNALQRWEASLEELCGRAMVAKSAEETVGWMHAAQNRESWKNLCSRL